METMTTTSRATGALRHPGIIACAKHGAPGSATRVVAALGYAAALSTPEADLWAGDDRLVDAVASALASALSWLAHTADGEPTPEDWDRAIIRSEKELDKMRRIDWFFGGPVEQAIDEIGHAARIIWDFRDESPEEAREWVRNAIANVAAILAHWVEQLEAQDDDLVRVETCGCRAQRVRDAVEDAVGGLIEDVLDEETAAEEAGLGVDAGRPVITDSHLFARTVADRAMSNIFQKGAR